MDVHQSSSIVDHRQGLARVFEPESTEMYINIEHTLFEAGVNDEFTVKVAEKPEEIKALLEVGFEYVLQKDNLIFLRKRK